jgi:hypothetical protein
MAKPTRNTRSTRTPEPEHVGRGMARDAGKRLRDRGRQIDEAVDGAQRKPRR